VYKSNIKYFFSIIFLRNLRKFFVLFSFSIFNFLSLYINTPHTHTPLGCLKKRTHTHTLNVQKKHYHICIHACIHIISLAQYVHKHTHTLNWILLKHFITIVVIIMSSINIIYIITTIHFFHYAIIIMFFLVSISHHCIIYCFHSFIS